MKKINFQNLPSTTTPINATNLNAIQSNVEDVFNGSETMGNIVVGSIRTKNMFDENAILRGYELIGSGTYIGGVNPNSNWYVSDFIEVQPNQKYYLTKGSSGSSNIFYNSNKEYVDIVSASSGVITIPNNNNIKYMRFNGLLSQLSNVQFEKGETQTTYTPYQNLNAPFYEEGTWTPVMDSATVTYTRQIGTYKRVGNIVYINCRLRGTITAVSGNGYSVITGLPYLPNEIYSGGCFEYYNAVGTNTTTINNTMGVNIGFGGENNVATIRIQAGSSAGASLARWVKSSSTFYLSVSGFYFVD